ncbi:MAG: hypothetical protein GWM98_04690 [Nitrospinaceae bacterium]|nr:hypothetical protein [Deltaproteobacteria bacterium]NIY14217.1 hypothetical protein [Nitrospinaceae bacterium]
MADLKLDENGDLAIEDGDLVIVRGREAIAQDLDIRLQFFQGEWFLDLRLGVPWYQDILGEKPRFNILKGIFRQVILGTNGVEGITDFRMTWDGVTRTIGLSFSVVSAEDGTFDYSKELIIK